MNEAMKSENLVFRLLCPSVVSPCCMTFSFLLSPRKKMAPPASGSFLAWVIFTLAAAPAYGVSVVIDSFSGSYLNRDIAYPGNGILNISITGDTNDAFLSTTTGTATAAAFFQSAIMLADGDAGTTDLRLAFSTPVTQLTVTFTDVDSDRAATFTALTPNDLLVAYEYAGTATATSSGTNAPTVPSGALAAPLTVLGQQVQVPNDTTRAIATFSFSSPQTFVRINYQNGIAVGNSGGVGVARISFEAVPEPSAAALLALSALALRRRKR
jgi:hypothetical protein